MKVILKEDVADLGRIGDLVEVKPGYGRNYLVPRGMAVAATEGNLRELEHQKRVIAKHAERVRRDAEALAGKIESLTISITAQAGAEERLFGSVTNRDIEAALAAQGVAVDRRQIHLEEPFKKLGEYVVPVKLGNDVEAKLKVRVIAAEG
jgi:large subunit ribosomal protein L9